MLNIVTTYHNFYGELAASELTWTQWMCVQNGFSLGTSRFFWQQIAQTSSELDPSTGDFDTMSGPHMTMEPWHPTAHSLPKSRDHALVQSGVEIYEKERERERERCIICMYIIMYIYLWLLYGLYSPKAFVSTGGLRCDSHVYTSYVMSCVYTYIYICVCKHPTRYPLYPVKGMWKEPLVGLTPGSRNSALVPQFKQHEGKKTLGSPKVVTTSSISDGRCSILSETKPFISINLGSFMSGSAFGE